MVSMTWQLHAPFFLLILELVPPVHTQLSPTSHSTGLVSSPGTGAPAVVQPVEQTPSRDMTISIDLMQILPQKKTAGMPGPTRPGHFKQGVPEPLIAAAGRLFFQDPGTDVAHTDF